MGGVCNILKHYTITYNTVYLTTPNTTSSLSLSLCPLYIHPSPLFLSIYLSLDFPLSLSLPFPTLFSHIVSTEQPTHGEIMANILQAGKSQASGGRSVGEP